jgi:hypothetical protein
MPIAMHKTILYLHFLAVFVSCTFIIYGTIIKVLNR